MRSLMNRFALLLVLLVGPLTALPAAAGQLDELLASGALGERYDGFVEARDPSVAATAQAINDKRRAVYEQRATETGQTVDVVGRIYAGEIWDRADPGTWFLAEDGSWVQK